MTTLCLYVGSFISIEKNLVEILFLELRSWILMPVNFG